MKNAQEILVEAQQLVADLQALVNTQVNNPTVTDVKVDESDGSQETLVPEADLPPAAPVEAPATDALASE